MGIVEQLRELLKDYPLPMEVPLTVPSGLLHAALEEIERLEEYEILWNEPPDPERD